MVGVGTDGWGAGAGWTHCWVLRERTGRPIRGEIFGGLVVCEASAHRTAEGFGSVPGLGVAAVCCLRFA